MLTLLARHDVQLPSSAVAVFAKRLVDDTLNVRKVSRSSCFSTTKSDDFSFRAQIIPVSPVMGRGSASFSDNIIFVSLFEIRYLWEWSVES